MNEFSINIAELWNENNNLSLVTFCFSVIIVLILFLVFQHDNNWRKPLKRVKTKGIWCPPVSSIYSKPNQMDLLGQQSSVYFTGLKSVVGVTEPPLTTMTINESKYFDNKFKQTPSASSFFQDYLNSSTANEKDTFHLSNVPKYNHEQMITGFLSDKVSVIPEVYT